MGYVRSCGQDSDRNNGPKMSSVVWLLPTVVTLVGVLSVMIVSVCARYCKLHFTSLQYSPSAYSTAYRVGLQSGTVHTTSPAPISDPPPYSTVTVRTLPSYDNWIFFPDIESQPPSYDTYLKDMRRSQGVDPTEDRYGQLPTDAETQPSAASHVTADTIHSPVILTLSRGALPSESGRPTQEEPADIQVSTSYAPVSSSHTRMSSNGTQAPPSDGALNSAYTAISSSTCAGSSQAIIGEVPQTMSIENSTSTIIQTRSVNQLEVQLPIPIGLQSSLGVSYEGMNHSDITNRESINRSDITHRESITQSDITYQESLAQSEFIQPNTARLSSAQLPVGIGSQASLDDPLNGICTVAVHQSTESRDTLQ